MDLRIEPAGPTHWPICRALLPDACRNPSAVIRGFLATQPHDLRVLGAAVVSVFGSEAWLALRVVVPARRQRAGSGLMNHCLDCADSIGCRSAVVVCDTLAEPSAKPFLNRFGFRSAGSFSTFEADFIPSQNALCAVRDRLVRSGRIPTGVTIVRLPEAPEHEVAQMIATYLAERSDLANEPLQLERGAEHWRDSIALLFRGHVAAVVLTEFSDGLANTVARIVAPAFRGGWANALLLGAIADIAAERKTERFRFDCRDDNRDTLKLARRVNAVPVAIRQRFEKVLRRA